MELIYKKQPLIRGRGVSYCKNLLSPRFENSEGTSLMFFMFVSNTTTLQSSRLINCYLIL